MHHLQDWKDDLASVNPKAADALADPEEYPNLFPGMQEAVGLESQAAGAQAAVARQPAAAYARLAAAGLLADNLAEQLAVLDIGDGVEAGAAQPMWADANGGAVHHQPAHMPLPQAAAAAGPMDADLINIAEPAPAVPSMASRDHAPMLGLQSQPAPSLEQLYDNRVSSSSAASSGGFGSAGGASGPAPPAALAAPAPITPPAPPAAVVPPPPPPTQQPFPPPPAAVAPPVSMPGPAAVPQAPAAVAPAAVPAAAAAAAAAFGDDDFNFDDDGLGVGGGSLAAGGGAGSGVDLDDDWGLDEDV